MCSMRCPEKQSDIHVEILNRCRRRYSESSLMFMLKFWIDVREDTLKTVWCLCWDLESMYVKMSWEQSDIHVKLLSSYKRRILKWKQSDTRVRICSDARKDVLWWKQSDTQVKICSDVREAVLWVICRCDDASLISVVMWCCCCSVELVLFSCLSFSCLFSHHFFFFTTNIIILSLRLSFFFSFIILSLRLSSSSFLISTWTDDHDHVKEKEVHHFS